MSVKIFSKTNKKAKYRWLSLRTKRKTSHPKVANGASESDLRKMSLVLRNTSMPKFQRSPTPEDLSYYTFEAGDPRTVDHVTCLLSVEDHGPLLSEHWIDISSCSFSTFQTLCFSDQCRRNWISVRRKNIVSRLLSLVVCERTWKSRDDTRSQGKHFHICVLCGWRTLHSLCIEPKCKFSSCCDGVGL